MTDNNYSNITTQGIKYTGSKKKLIPYIIDLISELDDVETVLDGFSGTTRVSQALAQCNYNVVSNDIAEWSRIFANTYLLANKDKEFYQKYIDELNSLEGYEGWFTQYYGASELNGIKRPFQKKNTMKLDAIRDKIDEYNLKDIDKSVLISALILALDKVDSTIGHYASYLSKWSKRSYNDLFLEVPKLVDTKGNHKVDNSDVFDILDKYEYDLAYFDPPYGSNNTKMPPSRVRYASYYHIWKTICLNDKPEVFGKANRREDSRDIIASTIFEDYRKNSEGVFNVTEAIKKLMINTNSKYIIFSYSNGGRSTKEELNQVFKSYGEVLKVVEIDYKKNIMSSMKWTNEWIAEDKKNIEFLFLIKKNSI